MIIAGMTLTLLELLLKLFLSLEDLTRLFMDFVCRRQLDDGL